MQKMVTSDTPLPASELPGLSSAGTAPTVGSLPQPTAESVSSSGTSSWPDAEKIADLIQPYYLAVRILSDGSVAALGDLIFTRAIMLDCDECGYAHRYCFEDRVLAVVRFYELKSAEDVPAGHKAMR